MAGEVSIKATAGEVAAAAVERIVTAAAGALAERGRFTLVLAGGSTPAAAYELLASPVNAARIDWRRTRVFFGDERCVPPEHEWSNYGLARRTLLDRVPVPAENVHRMRGELGAQQAAADYEQSLRGVFDPSPAEFPRFDLVLLGMGDDGHTASLFPGMPALTEREAWVADTAVPAYVKPQVERVTLTLPVLNATREVLFLVTGEGKAAMVRRVLGADAAGETAPLPAARVQPQEGRLIWLLDAAAARGLGEG